ncbi:Ras-related protein Rab-18-B [Trichinella spiralis]|uniref:Ras-related protein Rab-18-B n=1 Tax=Trichinella spiralis TaxID=6334 RepID=A0A0V1BYA3_TRISP|nr:Ras-related protein Rab-18-B [Trichinella spiralis]
MLIRDLDLQLPFGIIYGAVALKQWFSTRVSAALHNLFLPVMRGVVLIRNLPYGFFEAELWQYFEQFGKLNRLKLFHSKKTGRSKGYAMIEFANSDVAKIAASEVLPLEKVRNEAFRNWFRKPSGHYANKKTVQKQNSVKSPINVKNMQFRLLKHLKNANKKLQQFGIQYQFSCPSMTIIQETLRKVSSEKKKHATEQNSTVLLKTPDACAVGWTCQFSISLLYEKYFSCMRMNESSIFAELKISFAGDSFVGKTSILKRFTENGFDSVRPTIGVDYLFKTMFVNGKHVKLHLWDTAGLERFKSTTHVCYRNCHGIVFVYDVNCLKSFQSLKQWIEYAKLCNTKTNFVKMLIGNKVDLNEREVTEEEAAKFAWSNSMLYLETSAKTSKGVQMAFEELVRKILDTPDLWTACVDENKRRLHEMEDVSIDECANSAVEEVNEPARGSGSLYSSPITIA